MSKEGSKSVNASEKILIVLEKLSPVVTFVLILVALSDFGLWLTIPVIVISIFLAVTKGKK